MKTVGTAPSMKNMETWRRLWPFLPSVTTHLLKTGYDDKILAYLRKNGKKEVLVLLNFSKEKINFTVESEKLKGLYRNVFNPEEKLEASTGTAFTLNPWQYLVFEK